MSQNYLTTAFRQKIFWKSAFKDFSFIALKQAEPKMSLYYLPNPGPRVAHGIQVDFTKIQVNPLLLIPTKRLELSLVSGFGLLTLSF